MLLIIAGPMEIVWTNSPGELPQRWRSAVKELSSVAGMAAMCCEEAMTCRAPELHPRAGDNRHSLEATARAVQVKSLTHILFTDSWGSGYELKRMAAYDAYDVTIGLYSMAPRGL